METVDALILAGTPAGLDMSPENAAASRAMVQVGDRTMLQRVVDALLGCEGVSRIAAVGDVSADGLDVVLESGDSLVENIRRGMEYLKSGGRVLIATSDLPLLTTASVRDFLERAGGLNVDLAYPVIRREMCERAYPGMKRTYLKTAEGSFTGGNLMLVRPDFVLANWGVIAEAYAARKQIFALARIIGLSVLVRVLLGQVFPGTLSLAYLEDAVSRVVGAKVAAIVSEYPEIGEDVDKVSDLRAVRRILASVEKQVNR